MNEITKIKTEFYLKGKENDFYKKNLFNEALFRATNLVDELSINSLLNLRPNTEEEQTMLRFSYMSLIKKIHRFIVKTDDIIDEASLEKSFDDLTNEFFDATIFNRIRNSFDRVQTGTMNVELVDGVVNFEYNNIRNINADLYSRWVDTEKPFLNAAVSLNESSSQQSIKDFFEKEYNDLWDKKKEKPRNVNKMKLIYNNCYSKMVDELFDVKEDIEFKEFTLDQFRKVYSAIQAFGIVKVNSYIRDIIKKKTKTINPSVLMNYDDFIYYLISISNVEKKVVIDIVDMLLYDYEFHETRVGIYQHIFKSGNKIFYSSILTYNSMPQDKILYYLNKKGNNQQAITKIAHKRETLMTEGIMNFLKQTSNLKSKEGYVLYKNGKPAAEYDLIIVDVENKSILVCELKWFIKNDGELDLLYIDRKLEESIDIRIERLNLFKENKNEIISELFNIDIDNTYEIFGCIISENHVGSANIDDKLPIFDRFAFYFSLDSVSYNLKKFNKIIKEAEYLPVPPYETDYEMFEYYDQKYRCPVIKHV